MTATQKLDIRGLKKSYGNIHALRETSIVVPEGEFLTLLGPSGSGKTTLLMNLAGLALPDAGEVWIDGVESTYAPVHQRDIGLVFQNYALFPHLSVFENIAFPLRMRRVAQSEIARRVTRILETVHLPHVADRLPRELSGGQQQRIALARCAVYEPSVILMDEPLGALDKKLRDQMQIEIKRLHKELCTTVLYVTHDQEEAMAMSDRICLMRDGGIEQLGTPAELYYSPRTVFAADFFGGANIFEGSACSDGGLDVPAIGHVSGAASASGYRHLMIRAEYLRPLSLGEVSDNVLEATVDQVVMAGPLTRYHARLANGTPITATVLSNGIPPQGQVGETLRFGWSAQHTVFLEEGASQR